MRRLLIAGTVIVAGFFIGINPSRANPKLGQQLIDHNYSMLMEACLSAQNLNSAGKSNYSSFTRTYKIGKYIDAGFSASEAREMLNAVNWAMKKECPEVW